MIRNPKIGQTYWVSGHIVHAKDHVAQATVTDYAAEDGDRNVYAKIDVKLVPTEFRSRFDKRRYHPTVLHRRDLHKTMHGAIEAIRSDLFKRNVRREQALADLTELEGRWRHEHWEKSNIRLTPKETSSKATTGTRTACRPKRARRSQKS